LIFSAASLELHIDQQTGAWTRLIEKRSGRTLLESAVESDFVTLAVGGVQSAFPPRLLPPGDPGLSGFERIGSKLRMTGHSVIDTGDATVLRVECQEKDWSITFDYRIPQYQTRLERRFMIRYNGPGEVLLRGVELGVPLVSQDGDLLEIPVSEVRPSIPLDSADRTTAVLAPDAPGMLAFRNSQLHNALLWWSYSESEAPTARVTADGMQVNITFAIPLAARMNKGSQVSWGSDYIWPVEGNWPEATEHFQRWWKQTGVTVPEDRPKYTERALLFETQIGAGPFEGGRRQYNPFATTRALIEDLGRIRDLGFTVLELMPHHPSPSYSVVDYYNPSHQYCEQLKELVQDAHRHGIRVILDWITHGVLDKEIARKTRKLVTSVNDEGYRKSGLSGAVLDFKDLHLTGAPEVHPLRVQHPDWFMKREDGSLAQIYTWAFDLENREVQDYIIEAMKYYVREYDIDGFRADAPTWNNFPNWDRNLPYRASRSATGGVRLYDRALPILRRMKPDLMMYTEPSSPVFRRMFDVNYAYDELWMLEQLLAWKRSPGSVRALNASQVRVWMDNRRRVMPEGSITIHQVDSHDSFWFQPWGQKFRREQFGVDGFRALLFMLSTLDGGLMHYSGGEAGSEEFMKRVFALRSEIPQLSRGRCDYLKPRVSEDSVFAVLWESDEGWAIPLTNFGPSPVRVRVELSEEAFGWKPDGSYRIREAFRSNRPGTQRFQARVGRKLCKITVSLDSLESVLLDIREKE
jgi:hypothetical protein